MSVIAWERATPADVPPSCVWQVQTAKFLFGVLFGWNIYLASGLRAFWEDNPQTPFAEICLEYFRANGLAILVLAPIFTLIVAATIDRD